MFHKQISKHIELLFSIKWASSKFDFASETFWVAGSSKDGQYPYCPLPTPLLLKSLENPTTTTRTTATAVSSWSFWQSNNTSRGGQKERASLAAAWQPNREWKRCPADDEQCRMRHQKQQQQQQVRSSNSNNAAAALPASALLLLLLCVVYKNLTSAPFMISVSENSKLVQQRGL